MPDEETFATSRRSDIRRPFGALGAIVVAVGAIVGCAAIADLRDPVERAADVVPSDGGDVGAADDAGDDTTRVGEVLISPAAIDFGEVACSKAPEPKVLRLENKSNQDRAYEIQLPEGTAFAFAGESTGLVKKGTVKPGSVALVSISVTPRSAGELVTDLAVQLDDRIGYVPLRADGVGGQLEIAPTLIDFGELRAENAESSPATIVFQNTGNRDVSVSDLSISNNDFDVIFPDDAPIPAVIPPGKSLMARAVLVNGIKGADLTATATVETPLACTEPPPILLRGRRGDAKHTVSPVTVDLGDVPCNLPVTTKKEIVVSNYSAVPLTYEVNPLLESSRFVIESGGSGSIPPASDPTSPQMATIVVTAKPVVMPAAQVSETMRIQFSSSGGGSTSSDVTLTMRPAGVVITADPLDLNYSIFNSKITLKNSGNQPITLEYKTTDDSDDEFKSTKGTVSVEGGKTGAVNVGFWNGLTPKNETYRATIALTKKSGGELCKELPILKAHTKY